MKRNGIRSIALLLFVCLLSLLFAGCAEGGEYDFLGLDCHCLDCGILRLQELAYAREGSAGTYSGYEVIDLAVGIVPDFRTGCCPVGSRICRVHELTGDEAVRRFLCQFLSLGDGALHALGAFGQDQFRAGGFQDVPALHAHGFRHGQDDAIALGRRDGGQADACVAAGGLNDHRTFLQQALCFSILNHRPSNSIFNASSRIKRFNLSDDFGFKFIFLFNVC